MDLLSRLDLVFCVDITGSMGPFIAAAREQLLRVLKALGSTQGVELRVAIVGYRDVGSLELVERYPFAADGADTQRTLEGLVVKSPPENSDAAEAVFSGLVACLELPWREGAYRVAVLVGDAPPHGCGADARPFPDRFPERDPTGLSLDEMANRLEEAGVFVHALAMTPSNTPQHDPVLERAFERIGVGTGGSFQTARTGDAAMKVVAQVSGRCLEHLDFDRRLYAALKGETDPAALAGRLDVPEAKVHAGLMRLRQRRLIE